MAAASEEIRDVNHLLKIMREFPLATVISNFKGMITTAQVPLSVKELETGGVRISGHLPRRNELWEALNAGASALILFRGPHSYINPNWYEHDDVPTWNFISIQATGLMTLVESEEGIIDILRELVGEINRYEHPSWVMNSAEEENRFCGISKAVFGFYMEDPKLRGKFKLSQSRTLEDRQRIYDALMQRGDANSVGLANWTRLIKE